MLQPNPDLLYSAIVEHSEDAIINATLEGIVTSWNRAAENIFGYSSDDIVSESLTNIFCAETFDEKTELIRRVKTGEIVCYLERVQPQESGKLLHISSTIYPVKDNHGNIISIYKIAKDITNEIKAKTIIDHQATHDKLTGLSDRSQIIQLIEETIKNRSPQDFGKVFLFYIDLDRFKPINDYHGNLIGNKVLITAAKRIASCVRSSDTVARFGGDEFMVLFKDLSSKDQAETIAQKIVAEFKRPIVLKNIAINIYVSIGIAAHTDQNLSTDDLIRQADKALQKVKSNGRNGVYLYNPSLHSHVAVNNKLICDLPVAFEKNQFELVYQPIVNFSDLNVKKAEALIRWKHPLLGSVGPMVFIPIAEENGMVCQLGSWVFDAALSALQNIVRTFGKDFNLSINISPLHLLAKQLIPDEWLSLLLQSGMSGKNLTLEITESSLLQNTETTKKKIKDFKHGEIQVALDDFGTGYSCLGHLNDFEIDYVKIDKSFVRNISTSRKDRLLCEAIIAMTHKLDVLVIAEGIENREQFSLLREMGCDFGQGYFFSRPMDTKSFLARNFTAGIKSLAK